MSPKGSRVLKFSIKTYGKTLNAHEQFKKQLCEKKKGLTEVFSPEECDFILAFCPVVSRAGTNIDAALEDISDSKPAVLVVLHHTFDPEAIVPDSNRRVRKENVLTVVDCLFHEDMGLLACMKNKAAIHHCVQQLRMPFNSTKKDERTSHKKETKTNKNKNSPDPPDDSKVCKQDKGKMSPKGSRVLKFSIKTYGKTLNAHEQFKKQLCEKKKGLTEVFSPEECDFILAFCPVVSRAGTNIDAALEDISDSKPAVLVVLHHTFDPEAIVPDSNRRVRKENILTVVDCLFHEDNGLLACMKNKAAIHHCVQQLCSYFNLTNKDKRTSHKKGTKKNETRDSPGPPGDSKKCNPDEGKMYTKDCKRLTFYKIKHGKVPKVYKEFRKDIFSGIKFSTKRKDNVKHCDLTMAFCQSESQKKGNIDTAIQKIPDNMPAILVVLHQTSNPEEPVPQNRNEKNILIVHCLFEQRGRKKCPLKCKKNQDAVLQCVEQLQATFHLEKRRR